jgi:hypothetical protein
MANLKDTTVRYVNKDFEGFKRDLMRYAQAHFSGSYQDYNESSPGMMVLELQAYVGDVLAYYMDQQFLEIKAETARQLENIEAFAKMRGYKPKGPRAARVPVKWICEVPASGTGNRLGPDFSVAPTFNAGSQAVGPNGVTFELLEDLNMAVTMSSDGKNNVEWKGVPGSENTSGEYTRFALRRQGDMVAGTTVSVTATIPEFKPFLRYQLANADVQEVLDVYDDAGNQWYEVDYLAQNVVFDQVVNTGSDSQTIPYVLRYRAAPCRFVVERSIYNNTTYLQFGNGEGVKNDDDLIPNVANLALPITGRKTFTNFAIDPQNFLKTRGLGMSPPAGSRLTIRYRVGGGAQTNVDSYTINKPGSVDLFTMATGATANDIRNSIEVINLVPSEGGGPAETVSEIKTNAESFFASQIRAVTREDFLAQVMTMPARFGRPTKAYIKNADYNRYAVDLHVLSEDTNGNLIAPSFILRENIKTYLGKLRMMTEGINILAADVINIGVKFGVVISTRFNRAEVLTKCLLAMKDYLDTANAQIGQPLVLSDMRAKLQNIDGVISVYRFEITSLKGGKYATTSFDVEANTANGIVYCPPNAIFEVKFPDNDISGESK